VCRRGTGPAPGTAKTLVAGVPRAQLLAAVAAEAAQTAEADCRARRLVARQPIAQVGRLDAGHVAAQPAAQVGRLEAGHVTRQPAAQVGRLNAGHVARQPAAQVASLVAAQPAPQVARLVAGQLSAERRRRVVLRQPAAQALWFGTRKPQFRLSLAPDLRMLRQDGSACLPAV